MLLKSTARDVTATQISTILNITCHTGSHIVTCQPTQVNMSTLNPARQASTIDKLSTDLEITQQKISTKN